MERCSNYLRSYGCTAVCFVDFAADLKNKQTCELFLPWRWGSNMGPFFFLYFRVEIIYCNEEKKIQKVRTTIMLTKEAVMNTLVGEEKVVGPDGTIMSKNEFLEYDWH